MFASRQKYEDERSELLREIIKLILNSLFGAQIRKEINESYKWKSQHWMQTKYDDILLDFWKIPNENYIVEKYDGLDGNIDVKTRRLHTWELFFQVIVNEI